MNRTLLSLVLLTMLFGPTGEANGRDNHSRHPGFFELAGRGGSLFERPPTGQGLGDTYMYGFTLGIGRQVGGEKYWHQHFGFPKYGLRLSYTGYSQDIYGQTISLNPFLEAPFFRAGRFSLEYSLGLGLAYHTKPYNENSNPLNEYVGAPLTAVIDLGVMAEYQLSPSLDLYGGVHFTHYSLGNTRYPNKGIHYLAGTMGIRVYPHKRPFPGTPSVEKVPRPQIERKNDIYLSFAPSFKRRYLSVLGRDKAFFCSTLQLGYRRHFHPCFNWGAAAELFYMGSEKEHALVPDKPNSANLQMGVSGQFEVLFGRLGLNVGLGIYPFFSLPSDRFLYERLGLLYHFGKKTKQQVGIAIKANDDGSIDYIEWSYGISLFRF